MKELKEQEGWGIEHHRQNYYKFSRLREIIPLHISVYQCSVTKAQEKRSNVKMTK